MSCILCKEKLSLDKKEVASHFIKCGTNTLLKIIEETESNDSVGTQKLNTNTKKRESSDEVDIEPEQKKKAKSSTSAT